MKIVSNPVPLVVKRLSEIKNAETMKVVETFVLSLRQKDSCFRLTNKKTCFLENKISKNCYKWDTSKLAQTVSLNVTPIDSKRYWIHKKCEHNWIWSSWSPKEGFKKENLSLAMEKWICPFSNVARNWKHSMIMIKFG